MLSDETASVPFETSIASRSDIVESAAVSSAVVFTVIVAKSWRSSRTSTDSRWRRRDLSAEIDLAHGQAPFWVDLISRVWVAEFTTKTC